MGYPQKIVTCCYCGTRAALVLRGKTRHELSCSSCGAPLHDLKMLPKNRKGQSELSDRPRHRPSHERAAHTRPRATLGKTPGKPRRKRNRFLKKMVSEAFDILEDIFD